MKREYIFVVFVILTFASVALKPTFCLAQIEDVDLEKQREQIREYAQKVDNESAIKLAEEYLKTDSANIGVLVTLAECNSRIGKFAEAEEFAKRAVSIDTTNVWALRTSAGVYRVKAEQTEAVSTRGELLNLARVKIKEALKHDPKDAWANAEAALIFLAQGDKKQAYKLIEEALALQPDDDYIKSIKIKIESTP